MFALSQVSRHGDLATPEAVSEHIQSLQRRAEEKRPSFDFVWNKTADSEFGPCYEGIATHKTGETSHRMFIITPVDVL